MTHDDHPFSPPSELIRTVTRIETKVDAIKDDVIPPLTQAAGEARDGVLVLAQKQKVNQARLASLEDWKAPPREPCEMVIAHNGKITAQERELAGLSRWRWYVMGAALSIGLFAASVGGRALWSVSAAEAQQQSVRRDVTNNNSAIKTIRAKNQADHDAVLGEVKAVPERLRKVLDDSFPQRRSNFDDILNSESLSPRERRVLRDVLRRAGDRARREDSSDG